jgi:hypothetical protein
MARDAEGFIFFRVMTSHTTLLRIDHHMAAVKQGGEFIWLCLSIQFGKMAT